MVERHGQPAPGPGRLNDPDAGSAGNEGAAREGAGAPSPSPPAVAPTMVGRGDAELASGALVGVIAGALAVLAWSVFLEPAGTAAPATAMPSERVATFGGEPVSDDVSALAQWVARTHDAGGAPFVVIDKRRARVHVFDASAHLEASSPILLGSARGDDTVPGIGERPLADVRPEERTTPAGRFVGERGHNARNEDVVWVDYDAGVSMHRVLTTNAKERRLERLATPSIEDNRISYGCINVPVAFFETRLAPLFATRDAPIYVLPEVRTMAQVFGWNEASGGGPSSPTTLAHAAASRGARP